MQLLSDLKLQFRLAWPHSDLDIHHQLWVHWDKTGSLLDHAGGEI